MINECSLFLLSIFIPQNNLWKHEITVELWNEEISTQTELIYCEASDLWPQSLIPGKCSIFIWLTPFRQMWLWVQISFLKSISFFMFLVWLFLPGSLSPPPVNDYCAWLGNLRQGVPWGKSQGKWDVCLCAEIIVGLSQAWSPRAQAHLAHFFRLLMILIVFGDSCRRNE